MVYQATIKDAKMLRKGPWLDEEDKQLIAIVALSGQKRWDSIARASGLKRSGKSCRLRWLNYLRPNLKQGPISLAEEQIILQLHEQWGNKWSTIARRLPGRTDNEIKNYWRTHLRKKAQSQTQGHFLSFMDNAEKGSMVQKYEPDAALLSYQYLNSTTDIWATTENDCLEVLGSSSSSAIENSPFKSPISDWISGFSDDHQGRFDQSCIGSVCTNSKWNIVDDDETDTWGYYLDSLWDPN